MATYRVSCTQSNQGQHVGAWQGLDSVPAIMGAAARDEWRGIFDDSAPDAETFESLTVGDMAEFEDSDGSRWIVERLA